MSRRIFLLGLALALVALAFTLTDQLVSLRSGVTEANVKRIHAGMTLQEVEALLGGPAHESWWVLTPLRLHRKARESAAAARTIYINPRQTIAGERVWRGAWGDALVEFNHMDEVMSAAFRPPRNAAPGLPARFRTWLGR